MAIFNSYVSLPEGTDITQHVILILPRKKTKEEERKTMEKYGKAIRKLQ